MKLEDLYSIICVISKRSNICVIHTNLSVIENDVLLRKDSVSCETINHKKYAINTKL